MCADMLGMVLGWWIMFCVNLAWERRRHPRWRGYMSAMPHRMETKWFFAVWIARLAMLRLWLPGGTSLCGILMFCIAYLYAVDASFSSKCFLYVRPAVFIFLTSCW